MLVELLNGSNEFYSILVPILAVPKSRNSVAESGNSVDGKRKAERLLKVGISGKSSKSRNFFLNYGNLEKKNFFF